jgi:hypothetical protein
MICRKLYAHKGSILLNSGSDHGQPRRFFFFGSSLERILYVIPVMAGIVSGRSRMVHWYRSAKTKRRFAARAQTLNAHCFVRFASFAAFKKRPTVYRPVDQQPQYRAERARCAGYGLVTKFSSKITNSWNQKEKEKEN